MIKINIDSFPKLAEVMGVFQNNIFINNYCNHNKNFLIKK